MFIFKSSASFSKLSTLIFTLIGFSFIHFFKTISSSLSFDRILFSFSRLDFSCSIVKLPSNGNSFLKFVLSQSSIFSTSFCVLKISVLCCNASSAILSGSLISTFSNSSGLLVNNSFLKLEDNQSLIFSDSGDIVAISLLYSSIKFEALIGSLVETGSSFSIFLVRFKISSSVFSRLELASFFSKVAYACSLDLISLSTSNFFICSSISILSPNSFCFFLISLKYSFLNSYLSLYGSNPRNLLTKLFFGC